MNKRICSVYAGRRLYSVVLGMLKRGKGRVELKLNNKRREIPVEYLKSGSKYTIKQGDTLSSIARNNMKDISEGGAIAKIKSDNFMITTELNTGDELFITSAYLNR